MSVRLCFVIFITLICRNCYEGVSNFVDSSKDTSLFIKAVLDERFVLIIAPAGSGKTSNMNLLKLFLEYTVCKTRRPLPNWRRKESRNSKCFIDGGLKIYTDNKTVFYQHFGSYPVIRADFKDLSVRNFKVFLCSFRILLNEIFKEHSYVLNKVNNTWTWSSVRLHNLNAEKFISYWDEVKSKELDEVEIRNGLKYLSSVLSAFFNRKVFVLIDEFDTPVKKITDKVKCHIRDIGEINQTNVYVTHIVDLIGGVVSSLLKNNPFVERGLINADEPPDDILDPYINNVVRYEITRDGEKNVFTKFFKLHDRIGTTTNKE